MWVFNCSSGYFIVIFQLEPWAFHCDFSILACGISMWFFNCSLGYFIVIFQLQPWAFQCDFSIVALGISLWFFNCSPGHFIVIFQLQLWAFHCEFSIDTQPILLQIFNRYPAPFIAIFQIYPWAFLYIHCIPHEALHSGSMSGSSAYTLNENLTWSHQKVKKIMIQMISPIGGHPMGCWEGGHMTNCQKW